MSDRPSAPLGQGSSLPPPAADPAARDLRRLMDQLFIGHRCLRAAADTGGGDAWFGPRDWLVAYGCVALMEEAAVVARALDLVLGHRRAESHLGLLGSGVVNSDPDVRGALVRVVARHLHRQRDDEGSSPRGGRGGPISRWLNGLGASESDREDLRQDLCRHLRAVGGERRIARLLGAEPDLGPVFALRHRLRASDLEKLRQLPEPAARALLARRSRRL